jgi:hypothetical protein
MTKYLKSSKGLRPLQSAAMDRVWIDSLHIHNNLAAWCIYLYPQALTAICKPHQCMWTSQRTTCTTRQIMHLYVRVCDKTQSLSFSYSDSTSNIGWLLQLRETWTEIISAVITGDLWSALYCSRLDIFQCFEGNFFEGKKAAAFVKTPVNCNHTSDLQRQKYSKFTTLARTITFRANTGDVLQRATK